MSNTNTTTETTPATPASKPVTHVVCWCGCGGMTKSKFVQGHDSRFHSRAKKVLRGELNLDEQLALLPHDEARAEFTSYMAKVKPAEDARAAKLAKDAADKAAKKAADAQKKADEAAKKAAPKVEPTAAPIVEGTGTVIEGEGSNPEPETPPVVAETPPSDEVPPVEPEVTEKPKGRKGKKEAVAA